MSVLDKYRTQSFCLVVLICLWLPSNLLIFGIMPESSIAERRQLASFPKISLSDIDNSKKQFEQYFNDNFGLRSQLIALNSFLRYYVLNVGSDEIIKSNAGWLIHKNEIELNKPDAFFSNRQLEIIRKNLESMQCWLKKRNCSLFLLPVPARLTIYSEMTPARFKISKAGKKINQVICYLRANSSVPVIDVSKELLKEKKKRVIYYRTDTHWNSYGAYIASRVIINELRRQYDIIGMSPYDNRQWVYVPRDGGCLADMFRLKKFVRDEEAIIQNPDKPFARERKVNYENPNNPWPLVAMKCDHATNIHLVMLHDSFATYLYPFLSEYFRTSLYIWWHSPADFRVQKIINIERPNIVIYEIVEGFIDRLLEEKNFKM